MRKPIQTHRVALTTLLLIALSMLGSMLGGCTGDGTRATRVATSPALQNPHARATAESAMARGPLLVVVQGNPYTLPDDAFAARVLEDIQAAMAWTSTPRLTSDPAAATAPSLRVVMTFNAGAVGATAQCLGGTRGGAPRDHGAVRVLASLCSASDALSSTSGRIDRSSGIDDPLFTSLISQVTDDLFSQPPSRFPEVGIGIGGSFGVGSGGIRGGGVGVGVGF